MTHVITQEDYDVNPLIVQLGLNVGDTITFAKAEVAAEVAADEGAEVVPEAPADETVA
jgi:hypothetical protein